MNYDRKSRREFLRKLAVLAASGGSAAMIPQLRMIGSALANTTAVSDYKALVCIYLSGGNDSWNMVVPYDTTRFGVYSTSRSGVYDATNNPGGIALARPTLPADVTKQVITDAADANAATNQYFMHPNMPELASLYRSGNLALVANVGTLVKPITMADYSNSTNRPPQLFSHSDQENLWHQANTNGSSINGWGGLAADLIKGGNPNQQLSPCISIAGANRFEVGLNTSPYQMSSSNLSSLNGVCNPTGANGCTGTSGIRDTAFNNLLAHTYQNDFSAGYSHVFDNARDIYSLLSSGLTSTTLTTTFPANNGLASQLQMVARMIKLSINSNYATRQIFYVRMGGYDLHEGLMGAGNNTHSGLLTQLSQAMNAFWTAMDETGIKARNSVTAFTATEFARTLNSNGHGSDHAWGGVQMVLGGNVAGGGALKGGRIYSDGGNPTIKGFPNQSLTAPNNFNRGQMIPGISVDQYAATMAKWMGVTATGDQNTIFPNLHQFSVRDLGFLS